MTRDHDAIGRRAEPIRPSPVARPGTTIAHDKHDDDVYNKLLEPLPKSPNPPPYSSTPSRHPVAQDVISFLLLFLGLLSCNISFLSVQRTLGLGPVVGLHLKNVLILSRLQCFRFHINTL